MKKLFAVLLALVMVVSLAACGQTAAPAAETKPAETKPAEAAPAEAPATEPAQADPMEELIAAAKAEGELVVYGSCEEEYLAAACENFQKIYGIMSDTELFFNRQSYDPAISVETTLDMLYETGAWLDKYVKNAKPREKSREKAEKQEEDSKN